MKFLIRGIGCSFVGLFEECDPLVCCGDMDKCCVYEVGKQIVLGIPTLNYEDRARFRISLFGEEVE